MDLLAKAQDAKAHLRWFETVMADRAKAREESRACGSDCRHFETEPVDGSHYCGADSPAWPSSARTGEACKLYVLK